MSNEKLKDLLDTLGRWFIATIFGFGTFWMCILLDYNVFISIFLGGMLSAGMGELLTKMELSRKQNEQLRNRLAKRTAKK